MRVLKISGKSMDSRRQSKITELLYVLLAQGLASAFFTFAFPE
jgi:hypothetical protein